MLIDHPWNVDRAAALDIQVRLASLVIPHDGGHAYRLVAGVHVQPVDETTIRASISVVDLGTMRPPESATASAHSQFPYIPGFRAFQAGPAITAAFQSLKTRPDVVLWDGHGIAHPRRCGLASHLGVLLDIPSIGVSEQLLYGTCDVAALGQDRGSSAPIVDPQDDRRIGAAVRTRTGIRPVFVSVGHRVSLQTSMEVVLKCTARYRLPEPLRQARMMSKMELR